MEANDSAPEKVLGPDRMRESHEKVSEEMVKISNLYRDFFKNDERLFVPFTNILSLFQLGLRFLDECYRGASRESLVKGDLGNIRQKMYKEKLSLTTLGDVKTEFTPSHYESYIQIFGDPATAIDKYMRYKFLNKREADKEELSAAEEKELDYLRTIEDLAGDLDKSHSYLLEKQNYSQQDIYYIFSLNERLKKGLNVHDSAMFDQYKSSADVYQSLLLERVLGGFKATWYDKEKGGLSDQVIGDAVREQTSETRAPIHAWLDNYLADKAEQQSDFLKMILRGIMRSAQGYNAEKLAADFRTILDNNYIYKMFADETFNARGLLANQELSVALTAIFLNKNTRFSTLLSRLSAEVVAESSGVNVIAGGGIGAANRQVRAQAGHAANVAGQPKVQAANAQGAAGQPKVQAANAQRAAGQPQAQAANAQRAARQPQVQAARKPKLSTAALRQQLQKAGKDYEKFLAREKQNKSLTKKQIAERRKVYLANYVRPCEDYFLSLNSEHGGGSLSKEAYTLAIHTAHAFPNSYLYWTMVKRGAILAPANDKKDAEKKQKAVALIEPEAIPAPGNGRNDIGKKREVISLIDSDVIPAPAFNVPIPKNAIPSANLNAEASELAHDMFRVFSNGRGIEIYSKFEKRLNESIIKAAGKSKYRWGAKISAHYLARIAVRNQETKQQLIRLLRAPGSTSAQRKALGTQYAQLIDMCERRLGKSVLQAVAYEMLQQSVVRNPR